MQIKDFPRGIPSPDDFLLFQDTAGITKSCLISELPFGVPSDPGGGTGGTTANYPSGMKLWIEGGSLTDKSGNTNNATSVTGTNP